MGFNKKNWSLNNFYLENNLEPTMFFEAKREMAWKLKKIESSRTRENIVANSLRSGKYPAVHPKRASYFKIILKNIQTFDNPYFRGFSTV